MKIQHLPSIEKEVALSIRLEESFANEVKAYAEYIEMNTGAKLSQSAVAASMVKTFLTSEKKFQTWLKKRNSEETTHEKETVSQQTTHF